MPDSTGLITSVISTQHWSSNSKDSYGLGIGTAASATS